MAATDLKFKKELKEAIKSKKLVIGSNKILRGARNGSFKSVIYSCNSPENFKRNINYYGSVSKVKIKETNLNSVELGELCGRPFRILSVAIKK